MSLHHFIVFCFDSEDSTYVGPSIIFGSNLQILDKMVERFRSAIVDLLLELFGSSFPVVENLLACIVNNYYIGSS